MPSFPVRGAMRTHLSSVENLKYFPWYQRKRNANLAGDQI